jgi:hypothetical protein
VFFVQIDNEFRPLNKKSIPHILGFPLTNRRAKYNNHNNDKAGILEKGRVFLTYSFNLENLKFMEKVKIPIFR